jgi:SAM-dependent methyltransferase
MNTFDNAAQRFTDAIDLALERNGYVRGQLFLNMTARVAPIGGDVLDYGCGPGRLSVLLAREGFRVRGVDTSPGMLAQTRTLDRRDLDLKFDEIESMDDALQPGSCDAIVCSSVIEYVHDPDALLQGFYRALRRPGALVISFANESSLWRRYCARTNGRSNPMATPDHKTWRWRDFRELLRRNGFRSVIAPRFFESPWDCHRVGRLLRGVPFAGSLGVVAARPVSTQFRVS